MRLEDKFFLNANRIFIKVDNILGHKMSQNAKDWEHKSMFSEHSESKD